ncbi:Glyoxylase, beta-lactamase superfamily II [Pseudomonas flavescens]|uniref:Glyoxylase, beta-lactamase superfamily II n=1 Tax=Phytopseudomonas flavescens TaxID=29435 RepID=A0A1G8H8B1_9GAMM|nr:MBL fold metallo-hydrolase [Pseudomonas flavescens]SDI02914.1 Glyoxylase, beta-lactamase superfamily II [Pseudomonas flavescens]
MPALRLLRPLLSVAAVLSMASHALAAEPLTLEVYNPGAKSIFPVSAQIVSGPSEALLIDAQFQRDDAQALVDKVRATGKKLTTVYISHSDPDYYFGLDVIHRAFPDAKIVASAETVAAIEASKDGKLAHWGPILKDNAPEALLVPQALSEPKLTVDGQVLEIRGPEPKRTFVWIPALKTVVGGIPVSANIHVWLADTQTEQSRRDWLGTLDAIAALKPHKVVPGHYLDNADGSLPDSPQTVSATRDYLLAFEQEAKQAADSAQLIAAMRTRYPGLADDSSLELSAQVIKGEAKWPQ